VSRLVFDNVVVGAADTKRGARAVTRAVELARTSGGTVHIVTAFRREPVEAELDGFRRLAAGASVKVRTHPVCADPVEAITRVAAEERADLIVLGTRANDGSRRLSSVPQGVMDRVECAVLVV
jgi:nucleotide-binding universal stress UspA family protein